MMILDGSSGLVSGGGGPAFGVYGTSSQSGLTGGTYNKVTFNAKEFDTNNNFDATTNYRFTPTIPGYYLISFSYYITPSGGTVSGLQPNIYKNGVLFKVGFNSQVNCLIASMTALIYMNGTTDYLEFYGFANVTAGTWTINADSRYTFASGYLARAA